MDTLLCKNSLELGEKLNLLEQNPAVKSVMLLKTDDTLFTPEILTPLLNAFSKPLIGGVFHKLIFNSELFDEGVMLMPLPFVLKTQLFEFGKDDIFDNLKSVFSDKMNESGSVFIFTDAFVDAKSDFVEKLFHFFGFKFSFLGAGCGSESYSSFPCVISNSGVHANAAVIGFTDLALNPGVAHGWESISLPLKVTEAYNNKIVSINWDSAFDVYKEIVDAHADKLIDTTNFLDVAKSYPIGILKMDDDMVIRDPFTTRSGELHCLDRVEAGQYITILNGNVDTLIQGAKDAALSCNSGTATTGTTSQVFCVDCISRVKFLNGDYRRELEAIGNGQPVCGVVSFGEIANASHSFLEIYNKTVIVAKW